MRYRITLQKFDEDNMLPGKWWETMGLFNVTADEALQIIELLKVMTQKELSKQL